jgi:predicted outer membrane lipoprotein
MSTSAHQPGVQRQRSLPLKRAVEISWKNIRMRLSRSLLVTSGIVLALAFLTSINVTKSMVDGMRQWATNATVPLTDEYRAFNELRVQRDALEAKLATIEADIRSRTHKALVSKPKAKFDAEKAFGMSLRDLQKEIGVLPGTADDLTLALAADTSLVETFRTWLGESRQLAQVRAQIAAPQTLQQLMRESGVPSTPDEIENNRIQTRWLLGLALLVAFVGILNAMLMSVTERFREIGTMKCLGALDGFIIKLFLIESLFQGMVGTILGIIVGIALSLLSILTTYGRFAWTNILWGDIGLVLAMCFLVGVVLTVAGAVYPAWQAARMQPIEAMRTET